MCAASSKTSAFSTRVSSTSLPALHSGLVATYCHPPVARGVRWITTQHRASLPRPSTKDPRRQRRITLAKLPPTSARRLRPLYRPCTGDREQRRYRLQAALDELNAFRQWCSAHQPRETRQQQQQQAQSSSASSVATLADLAVSRPNASPSSSTTSLSSDEVRTWSLSTSSLEDESIPPPERRLLTHYASLLHAVRQSAVQVSTFDFWRLFASAVATALAPPSTRASPPHLRGSAAAAATTITDVRLFSIPRTSSRWDKADMSVEEASRGLRDGEAVTLAERRLAFWAAQWYDEVLQRHALPNAPKERKTRDTVSADEIQSNDADDVENVSGEEKGEDGDVSLALSLLLLQGAWPQALRHLTQNSGGASPSLHHHQSVETLFCQSALQERHRVFLRPCGAGEGGNTRAPSSAVPRLPRHRVTAAVTPVELRLLRSPPSAGLRVLGHESNTHEIAKERNRVTHSTEDGDSGLEKAEVLHAATAQEVAHERDRQLPPPSSRVVVRLRQRLWLLQHLPRRLPPSLILFEEGKRGRHRAAMPHAYLERCNALEKLPWYPLCVLGRVFDLLATTQHHQKHNSTSTSTVDRPEGGGESCNEEVAQVLRDARVQLRTALFDNHADDYASVLDYVHLLFVSLGSTMTAHHVSAAIRRENARGSAANSVTASFERAFADTAIALFRPPHEDEATEVKCASWRSLLGEVEAAEGTAPIDGITAARNDRCVGYKDLSRLHPYPASRSDSADITARRRVATHVFDQLCAAVQCWSNYHRSLYCETLSYICDSNGVALQELRRLLSMERRETTTPNNNNSSSSSSRCPEKDNVVVVVLAPESAAAITTTILLQRLAKPPSAAGCGAPDDDYPNVLFFAVPRDKTYAVSSYFKGVFHPSFFQRVCPAATGVVQDGTQSAFTLAPEAWESSAAARLVGRSLRRVDRYPTRTTEAFFARYVRGDDNMASGGAATPDSPYHKVHESQKAVGAVSRSTEAALFAPPLAVDLYTVDLQAAETHWRAKQQQRHSYSCALGVSGSDAKEIKTAMTDEKSNAQTSHESVEEASMSDRDAVVLVAAPPLLPYGLRAVYKPAHVNCTLHAHYASLVYPYLSQDLPWCGEASCGRRSGGSAETSGKALHQPSGAVVIPSTRQQGLVNRIDVGTSGVVLVARDAPSLQRATDAMVRQHLMRKTYRALVQRWPPLSPTSPHAAPPSSRKPSNSSAREGWRGGTPLFATAPFLSSLPSAVICAPVYAAGATASAIQNQQQQQPYSRSWSDSITRSSSFSLPSSSVPSQEHQKFSRQHAALHDRRPALTRYRVLEWFDAAGVAYVQVDLDSGRRHQIRQHFAQLGFPLLGDARYHPGVAEGVADTSIGMRRAALHAYSVELLVTGGEEEEAGRVVVQVPMPADILHALRTLRAQEAKTRQRREDRHFGGGGAGKTL